MLKPERYFVICIVDKANDSLLFMRSCRGCFLFQSFCDDGFSIERIVPLSTWKKSWLHWILNKGLKVVFSILRRICPSTPSVSFDLFARTGISSNCYYKFLPDESWISRERRKWWLFKSWNERWIRTSLQERFLHKERKCWQKSLSINLRENFLTMCLELFY